MGNKDPLPIDKTGNGARIKTLEFDEADAYMLVRALSIAACTAMMCSGIESVGRLRHYQEQFAKLAPEAADLLDRPEDLCEIAIVSSTVPEWSVYRVREHEWSDKFRTVVSLGDRKFFSGFLVKEEDHQKIIEIVRNLVFLTCLEVPKDDVIDYPWRRR